MAFFTGMAALFVYAAGMRQPDFLNLPEITGTD